MSDVVLELQDSLDDAWDKYFSAKTPKEEHDAPKEEHDALSLLKTLNPSYDWMNEPKNTNYPPEVDGVAEEMYQQGKKEGRIEGLLEAIEFLCQTKNLPDPMHIRWMRGSSQNKLTQLIGNFLTPYERRQNIYMAGQLSQRIGGPNWMEPKGLKEDIYAFYDRYREGIDRERVSGIKKIIDKMRPVVDETMKRIKNINVYMSTVLLPIDDDNQ